MKQELCDEDRTVVLIGTQVFDAHEDVEFDNIVNTAE